MNNPELHVDDEDGQFFEEIEKIVDGVVHDMRTKKERGQFVSISDGHDGVWDAVVNSAYITEIPLMAVALRAGLPKVADMQAHVTRIRREMLVIVRKLADAKLEADPFYKQVYKEEVEMSQGVREHLLLDLIKLGETEPRKIANFLKNFVVGNYDYNRIERFLQNPNEEEDNVEETNSTEETSNENHTEKDTNDEN